MSTTHPAPPGVALDDMIDARQVGRFHLLVLSLTGSGRCASGVPR
jgi:hypothetical protein